MSFTEKLDLSKLDIKTEHTYRYRNVHTPRFSCGKCKIQMETLKEIVNHTRWIHPEDCNFSVLNKVGAQLTNSFEQESSGIQNAQNGEN